MSLAVEKESIIRYVRTTRKQKMMEIENSMIVDWWWDEQEYHIPNKRRLKMEQQAYEEAEREDKNEYAL